jgi:hypothetical protein
LRTILAQIATERRGYATTILPLSDRPIGPADLPKAAAAMALLGDEDFAEEDLPRLLWPWKQLPGRFGTPRANLIRSAALIVAAIQRLDIIAKEQQRKARR